MNSLIEVTQTVLFTPARLLGQVEYCSEGRTSGPSSGVIWRSFDGNDRGDVESVYQSRPTRLGQHHSDLQPLHLVQDRRAAWWWILLMLIPFVNFIIRIILCIDLAKSFGKGVGFGIGLALLGIIFFPILGFGSAQYQGPTAGSWAPGTDAATCVTISRRGGLSRRSV